MSNDVKSCQEPKCQFLPFFCHSLLSQVLSNVLMAFPDNQSASAQQLHLLWEYVGLRYPPKAIKRYGMILRSEAVDSSACHTEYVP